MFWALIGGFVAGVFLRSVFTLDVWFAALVVLCATIVIACSHRKEKWVIACAIAAVSLGIVRMDAGILHGDTVLNARLNKHVEFIGIITTEPDLRDSSTLLTVAVYGLASSTEHVSATVLAVAPAQTSVSYGDVVHIAGTVKLPQPFDGSSGRVFDYPGYLASQGISYQILYAQVEKESDWKGSGAIAAAIAIKQMFVRGIERALPEPEGGLAAGIMAGDKRGIGSELTDDFRVVSLVHIIVLSGYNITVVIAGLYEICRRLRAPRSVYFGGGIIIAAFFAGATGFAAASLRACLMVLVMITGEWSGRIYRADRALGCAIVAMLLWNPYLLMFDPGFQLSFMATVGLMVFSPLISPVLERLSIPASARDILSSSMSAQIAVLPLLLYSTGQLSLVALPANLLVLTIMQQAMLLTLFAALAGMIAPFAAPVIGFPAYVLLWYIIGVAKWLSHVPFATVAMPVFNGWWLLPVYATLLVGAYSLFIKQKAPPSGLFVES